MRLRSYVLGYALLVVLGLPAIGFAGEIGSGTASRPPWCQTGWTCVPTAEIEADTAYKINLEEALAKAQAKKKRFFDLHMGCGPGIGAVVTNDWDARGVPIPLFCGVIFGI